MDAIFAALDLSAIATFITTAGVLIVGIAMADKSKAAKIASIPKTP